MTWIAVGLSLVLLIWLLYKEWNRSNRKWLTARLIATVFAVAALLLMAIPLHYQKEHTANEKTAILLTQGWDKDSVQKFLREYTDTKVYTLEEDMRHMNASYLPDLRLLALEQPSLHIFGYGLKEAELSQVKNLSYQFHPTVLTNTIQQVTWNETVPLGQSLQVQVTYNNAPNSPASVVLSGFSTTLDSVVVPAKKTSYFQLTTFPRQIGKALFTISVLQNKDTLAHEPLPITVEPTKQLRLLLLSSSPDFEKKFLKDWLAEHNFSLAIKTLTTSRKWDQQFINRPARSMSTITTSLLQEFDIVLADQKALSNLSASENGALQWAIGNNGLGLVVQADSALRSSSFYGRPFAMTGIQDSVQHHLKLKLNTELSFVNLSTESPLFIRPNEALQTVVHDASSRMVAGTVLYGKGRILFTTINNSFTWQLSGQSSIYNRYWSSLLNAVAPKEHTERSWTYQPSLPQKDEAVQMTHQYDGGIPSLQVGQTILHPAQDYFLSDQWHTTFWPRKAGWQPVITDGSPAGWFYVYEPSDWSGVKNAERLRQTKQQATNISIVPDKKVQTIITEKEIPLIYFFLLFLVSASFLWYEKKGT